MSNEYKDQARTFVQVTLRFAASGVLELNEEQCIDLFKELIHVAQWLNDKDTLMLVCNEHGLLLSKLKLYNEAMKYQEIHLSLAIKTNNKDHQVKAYDNLGYIYLMLQKPWNALTSYENKRSISKEIGDKKEELESCEMLAAIHLALGHHVEAVKLYKQQLDVALETDNNIEQKSAYINMIKAYEKMDDIPYDEITTCYEKWLNVPSQDEKQEKGNVYGRLGNIYQQLNNFEQAIRCYQKSLEIAKLQSSKKLETMLYLNLGLAYFSHEQFQEASECYKNALDLAIQLEDRDLQGKAYDKLGRLCAQYTKDYAKSIEYCKKALQIAEAMDDVVGQLDCHELLGCIHLKLGDTNNAVKSFKKQLDFGKKMNNVNVQKMANLNMADAYSNANAFKHIVNSLEDWLKITSKEDDQKKKNVYLKLGNAYQELGNTNEAVKCYKNSLEIIAEFPDQKLETILNINIGYSYFSENVLEEAGEYYQKGLDLALKLDDKTLKGKAYDKLGHLYEKIGNGAKAIEHFEKAIKVTEEANDEAEAMACENLGDFYIRTRNYKKALQFHHRQLQICSNIKSKSGQARAYRKLGINYEKVGDYHEALKNVANDLNIRVEIDDKKGEAEALINLGDIYKLLGQFHEALQCHRKCLDAAKLIKAQDIKQRANRRVGDILFLLQEFDEAAEHLKESLDIARSMDDKESIGYSCQRLGLCMMKFSKYHKALELFDEQIRLAKEIGDKELEADGYFNNGTTCSILKNYQQAMIWLKEHLKIAEATEIKDTDTVYFSFLSLGKVYISIAWLHERKGEKEETDHCISKSIYYSEEALRWYEKHLHQLREQDHLKISFLETFYEHYNYLALMLIANERKKDALLASERGRARVLSDLLVLKYNMDNGEYGQSEIGPIAYDEIEKMAAHFSIIFYFWHPRVRYTWVIDTEKVTTLRQDVEEDAFSRLIKDNVYGIFRDREVKCEDRSAKASEEQDKGKLSVPSKCIATSIVSEKLMLCASEKIKTRCIPDEDLYDYDNPNTLEGLYKSLISPVLNELSKDELVIIPDGALFMVPFAALRDPDTGEFLSETKQIRLAPSLTTLKTIQESSADVHKKTGALIIGNPQLDLPYAEKEAKMIANLLNVKPLIGQEATKKATKEFLQKGVAVVHFAAHGATNGKIFLASSGIDDLSNEQDYILTMKDVQESGGYPQLVVLSCCHSGRGEIKAEGVVGMSRAFLAAGARAVVASLWAIDDEATMMFMERFYTHLKIGESASKSLQQAMKDMRESPKYSDPQFWAPFFLIGDDITIKMFNE